ncbi:MAG: hypothetical protein AUK34_04150 [Ignavibacteria bacterium CG2_30_36_16]|nr:MAG: hypothetical protein AUK34_04150 [Ignavibacteria bacterium CG2_30_36_16]
MRNIWILMLYTLREAFARKVFLFFMIISGLILLTEIVIFSMVDTEKIIASLNSTGDPLMRGQIIEKIELAVYSFITSLLLLLAIFASASFVPNMLEKGTVDLFLSKPISRSQLLLGKYFGGLLVVFINISFLILGMWLLVSFKFSYWDFSFLSTILFIVFTFAVLYSLLVFFGVLTQGSTAGMMIAYFIYIILSPLLAQAYIQIDVWTENKIYIYLVKGLYYIVPKTAELLGTDAINVVTGAGIDDYQPIITSFLFLILMLGFSIVLFRKKDF